MVERQQAGPGPREVRLILQRMATIRPRKSAESFAQEFGARLRAVREKRGFTQSKLAESIGTYAPQISKYETGEVVPEGETLAALAEVLDVSLDELVLGRSTERADDVRDARLRTSVRALEETGDRRLLDMAATMINGLVLQAHHARLDARPTPRRKR
jgi:transcriptional regulator with XRE-family HTH domain